MDPEIHELKPHECPLLRHAQGLLEDYLLLFQQFRIVEQKLSEQVATDSLYRELQKGMAGLCKTMRLEKYPVGFIGPYQQGKSTAFNKVLEASDDRAPAKEGSSGATTAIATRLRALPVAGKKDTLKLCYMLREEYEEKCRLLYRKLVDPDMNGKVDERQLLTVVQTKIRDAEARSQTVTADNLKDLQRLLRCGQDPNMARRLLEKEPRYEESEYKSKDLDYAWRFDFINRQVTTDSPKAPAELLVANPLLREVEIGFRTNIVKPELEMVDLPGLDSKWDFDTVMTQSYYPGLKGVLLFDRATATAAKWVANLVESDLATIFPRRIHQRLWVVFTYCDGWGRKHWGGAAPYVNDLLKFLTDNQLRPSQVCFVCGKWPGRTAEDIDKDLIAMGDSGKPIYEHPALASHPELQEALKALRDHGGIPRLRELVSEKLKAVVEAEVQNDCWETIRDLRSKLSKRLEHWKKTRVHADKLATIVDDWQTKLTTLITDLGNRSDHLPGAAQRRDFFSGHAQILHHELREYFDKNVLNKRDEELIQWNVQKCKDNFLVHARALDSKLAPGLVRIVADLHTEIGNELLALPQDLELTGNPTTARQTWNQYVEDDSRPDAWQTDTGPEYRLPTFDDAGRLFDRLTPNKDGMIGTGYRDLLHNKIREVVYQSVHAIRTRLRRRLEGLEERITAFAKQRAANPQAVANWPDGLDDLF